jgi:nicotinamidase-related amidase
VAFGLVPPPPAPTLRAMAREPQRSTDILDAVALLVVDMQDVFIKMVPDGAAVAERCGFAIEAARLFGLKVLFSEQVPQKLGPTHAPLLALAPGARVFAKSAFSAMQADGLQEHLRKLGVYHLLLVGIETPVCVYQTALHAHDSDFDVTVLADCVGGRRSDDGRVALDAMARNACHVLSAETVFYSMLATCAHPRFSEFTRLVKKYSTPGALLLAPIVPATQVYQPVEPPPPPADEPVAKETPPERESDEQENDERESDERERADEPSDDDAGPPDDEHGRRFADDDEASEEQPRHDQGEDRPRRGRRRRGGARRRRARERAAALANGTPPPGGTDGQSVAAPAEAPAAAVEPAIPAAPAAAPEAPSPGETPASAEG